jgi:hypothetical protein
LWRRSRLYFRMAHITSNSLKWRKTGYNMDLFYNDAAGFT